MTIRTVKLFTLLSVIFSSCGTEEFDCDDMPIQPAFIGFKLTEIDTLIFRKFKPNEDLRNLVDTTVVTYNNLYRTSNDTTKIIHYKLSDGIKPGFDWQLFIPAINRTILVSDIASNKKSGSCGTRAVGSACTCLNDLFSAKQDGSIVTFSDVNDESPFIYIRK